jgi:SAM-dependent methyltransferase
MTEISDLDAAWWRSDRGVYVAEREQAFYDRVVADIFGFNAVQIGAARLDCLNASRMPLRFTLGPTECAQVRADPAKLPLASQSIDLVAMPHVLEFAANPHQVLREVERVLMPEGQLVLSGFNPMSLWGLNAWLRRGDEAFPWRGRFLHLARVKDWLALLGFELAEGSMSCYSPPFTRREWLERMRFMEPAGDRWWAMGGGVYFLRAIKRVQGMRVIMPGWRERAAVSLAPAATGKVVSLSRYRKARLSA